jgi:hypothetical protein
VPVTEVPLTWQSMVTVAPFATVLTAVALAVGARRTLRGSPAVLTVPLAAADASIAPPVRSAPTAASTRPEPAIRRNIERFMSAA